MDIDSNSRINITATETKVLEMLRRGLTNREIAHELCRSEHTVKTHVEHILAKTGARNRAQVGFIYRSVELASENG